MKAKEENRLLEQRNTISLSSIKLINLLKWVWGIRRYGFGRLLFDSVAIALLAWWLGSNVIYWIIGFFVLKMLSPILFATLYTLLFFISIWVAIFLLLIS